MGNWLVLGILLVLVCVSAGAWYRQRKKGGCGCGCSGCSMGCTGKERQKGTDATDQTEEERKKTE